MKRGNGLKRKIDAWIGIPTLIVLKALCFFSKKSSKVIQADKIAILIFGAIGDATLARTMTDSIRYQYPKVQLSIYLSEENAAASFLFEGFHVEILKITSFIHNVYKIRAEHFDVWIDTSQWARITALYSFYSKSKVKIGFNTPNQWRHFLYDFPIVHRKDVHELTNFHQLLCPFGITNTPDSRLVMSVEGEKPFQEPYVVLHFFASGYLYWLREWPLDAWKSLIENFQKMGWGVVLSGSPSDLEKLKEYLKSVPDSSKIQIAAGRYSLKQLVSILKDAECVISVNTSIVHLASIVDAKIIALNGPTNSLRWGAWGKRSINIDVPKEQGGGFLNLGYEYPKAPHPIMHLIHPQQVMDAVLLLKEK